MSCTLTFEIQGSLYSMNENGEIVPVDSSTESKTGTITIKNSKITKETSQDQVWSKIIETLNSNKEQKEKLLEYLKYIKNTQKRKVDANIIKKEGLVANSKYSRLRTKYEGETGYNFYDFEDGNPNILLISNLRINGKNYEDVIVGKDFRGEPLYIVRENKESINKLNNHLYVKNLIQTKFDGKDERLIKLGVTENMKSPIKIKGRELHNQKELLIDYITHVSDYKNNRAVMKYIGAIDQVLMDLKDSKLYRYSDSLDQNFSAFLKNNKTKIISPITFYKFLESNKETKELIKGLKQSDEKLRDPEFIRDLFGKFQEKLKEFTCKLQGVTEKGGLIINTQFLSLNNVLDITYDTTISYKEHSTYRGYDIKIAQEENGKQYVIFDKNIVTPNTSIYNRVEIQGDIDQFINEVIKPRIDQKISQRPTAFDFEYGMYNLDENLKVQSVNFYKLPVSDTIIKVLDIDSIKTYLAQSPLKLTLPDDLKSIGIHESETDFLPPTENTREKSPRKATIEDFYEYMSHQLTSNQLTKLKEVINNGEKVGLFLIAINKFQSNPKLRNFKTTNSEAFNTILGAFENVQYKQYYVQKSSTYGQFTRNVISNDKPIVINTQYNRPEPIIAAISNTAEKLSKMFGIEINVWTSDMIQKYFPDISVTTTKAFIRNGIIYINGSTATSDDVVHEYTHLFLGVLKANAYDVYIATMEAVDKELNWIRKRIQSSYPNLSRTDLNEEAFAIYFGEYLAGRSLDVVSSDIENKKEKLLAKKEKIESNTNLSENKKNKQLEDCESKLTELITGLIGRPVADIANSKIDRICKLISKDIALNGKTLEYSQGTVYRQTSNLISKDIKDKKIIENCD